MQLVTLDIKAAGTIGIIRESNSSDSRDLVQSLMDNLILDLCFHHNPEDLQICIFLMNRMIGQNNNDG